MAQIKKTSKIVEITISPQEYHQGTFPDDPIRQGGSYVRDMGQRKLRLSVVKSATTRVFDNMFEVTFELS